MDKTASPLSLTVPPPGPAAPRGGVSASQLVRQALAAFASLRLTVVQAPGRSVLQSIVFLRGRRVPPGTRLL